MSSCVFPGSFDPVTRGHLNLIERAAQVFDRVTVTVMVNRSKSGRIPYSERVRLLRRACEDLPNVTVDLWEGLLADYMRNQPGSVVIRGVRDAAEYCREIQAADINRQINPSMETVFMPAAAEWSGVSSSAVCEIASFGGDIRPFVPECVYQEIDEWLTHKKKD